MMDFTSTPALVITTAIATALAVGFLAYVLLMPWPTRVPIERRRPGHIPTPGLAERVVTQVTTFVEGLFGYRSANAATRLLDLAAIGIGPEQFAIRNSIGALAAAIVGFFLGGWILAIVFALAVPVIVRIVVGMRISKRQQLFADQLEDSLQLIAASLRAGHNLPQALASLVTEAESPTSEEFTRVVNETRLGRDLGDALDVTAQRMNSEDFIWVTQAIEINREVGGNLAAVLDGVAGTIRQRNEIRRQVATLSAEGRLSAIILMMLPFGVGGFLLMTNPSYLAPFTESLLGYGLLATGGILLIVGAAWLRKTVEVKF